MAKPMDQYKWHELNVGCVIEEVGNRVGIQDRRLAVPEAYLE